jgi:hypothetical protein
MFLVLGFVSACDSPESLHESLHEWEMQSQRFLDTEVPLTCPSQATPVKYDGHDDTEQTFPGQGFWMGQFSCRHAEDWDTVQAILREVELKAIEECEEDRVKFSCPEPCTLLTHPGTCEIQEGSARAYLVSENPPTPEIDWSCTMSLEATAVATDIGICLEVPRPDGDADVPADEAEM